MLPSALETAIFRTVLYADIFDYPLTSAELHHYLIVQPATLAEVETTLQTSAWLAERLMHDDGYVMLATRPGLVVVRAQRAAAAQPLWARARRWARWLGRLPFVRLVAVTGALAMDNAPRADDIDLLVVTAPGRAWLTRALVVGLVRVARLENTQLCPNYVLTENALTQTQQDLFTAHDVAQMVPLVGQGVYEVFRARNLWVARYLPQATRPWRLEPEGAPQGAWAMAQQYLERGLQGLVGDALERWERIRKVRKWAEAMPPAAEAQAPTEVVLDAEQVKGHFRQHGRAIMQRYAARLRQWELAEIDVDIAHVNQ